MKSYKQFFAKNKGESISQKAIEKKDTIKTNNPFDVLAGQVVGKGETSKEDDKSCHDKDNAVSTKDWVEKEFDSSSKS